MARRPVNSTYRVTVAQTAAYAAWDLDVQASSPGNAALIAKMSVAADKAGEGSFIHSGSTPGDVRAPYVVSVRKAGCEVDANVPLELTEICAQFPLVETLIRSAETVIARWERGDLAEAVRALDAALEPFRDV